MDNEQSSHRNSASGPEERAPSPPDLQQWMETIWTRVFGFSARSTDVLVVRQISDEPFESRADAIADLLWDHWMGESEEPSAEQVRQFVVDVGRELAKAADEEPPEGS